ncbi:Ku protein [Sinorhizobium meliloti]|uniref:Ku protein n=1 Tax=Rhizobium meliloti TaxID=382 RepID=UPI002278DF54|nr:Ku protein [Sinorhizobium meliloti]
MLEDEELENVALESTKTIDISTFTPRDSIEWIWLDTPYYLSPNDTVGQEAFSVIRDAMEAQNMVGISRLVISRRERAVISSHVVGYRSVDAALRRRSSR